MDGDGDGDGDKDTRNRADPIGARRTKSGRKEFVFLPAKSNRQKIVVVTG
jgi:hypothetical protein